MPPKVERKADWMLGATGTFGRDALFGASENTPVLVEADVGRIDPNPHQPRTTFDAAELEALKTSLARHGLQQPIGLKQKDDGRFELVYGERRLRAAKLLGWPTIFGVLTTGDSSEIALIENLQRTDLSPIEECDAYHSLMRLHGYKAVDLVRILAKDKSEVSRTLALERLPPVVREEYPRFPVARYRLVRIAAEKNLNRQTAMWEAIKADMSAPDGIRDDEAPPAENAPRRISAPVIASALPKGVAKKIQAAHEVLVGLTGKPVPLAAEDRERLAAIHKMIEALLSRSG
jgi:ParB family chromosome partitioning protein